MNWIKKHARERRVFSIPEGIKAYNRVGVESLYFPNSKLLLERGKNMSQNKKLKKV